jgi:hypothetical protein
VAGFFHPSGFEEFFAELAAGLGNGSAGEQIVRTAPVRCDVPAAACNINVVPGAGRNQAAWLIFQRRKLRI